MNRKNLLRFAYAITALLVVTSGTAFVLSDRFGLDGTTTVVCGVGAVTAMVAHCVIAQARVVVGNGNK